MSPDQENTMTEPSAAYVESPPDQLMWLCEACGVPIADGDGYLHVDLVDVARAQSALVEVNQLCTVDVAQLLTVEDVHWRTHHARCDPRPEAIDYCIDVARARDHADLLARTAHLSGKRWIDVTDWYDLMARMASVSPRPTPHAASVRAQALREAAADAREMHDPVAPDCEEWATWLEARADTETTAAEGRES